MSRAPTERHAPTRDLARSARHGPCGCPGKRVAGAASACPPAGAAPTPVSAVARSPMGVGRLPLARPSIAAALTILDGKAAFRVVEDHAAPPHLGRYFRIRSEAALNRPRVCEPGA